MFENVERVELFTKDGFRKALWKVDEFVVPGHIRKIPKKIGNTFHITWVQKLNYFVFNLFKGHCPYSRVLFIECLRNFLLACRNLSLHITLKRDVTVADTLLQQFCLSFENLYNEGRVTQT